VSASTYILLVGPVQSTLGMHEGDPMVRNRIAGNQGEYTLHPTTKRRDSPHELCSDRGESVFFDFAFDDDPLVSPVSVDSYHGPESVVRAIR